MPRATATPDFQEIVKKDSSTKTTYHYVDKKSGVDVRSREVFKRSRKVIHYPFNTRNGRTKYKTLEKIIYDNIPDPLPAGFIKAPNRGYGFTRELSPLLYALQDKFPRLTQIVVSKDKPNSISKKEAVLNLSTLMKARPRIAANLEAHRDQEKVLSTNILADVFPKVFHATRTKYTKGQLNEFVKSHLLKTSLLSEEDIIAIAEMLKIVPKEHAFVKKGQLLATKESFDKILIEGLISKFEKLLARKTDSKVLEKDWQEFFAENILYFNFGYVERFEKERIQGDKSLNVPDFIMLNTFGYLDVIEIKTHLTQLLAYDRGRKNFYWTSEAAKAISQAENYIDSLIKQEDVIIKNIRDEYGINNVDAVRPTVYVIASSKECLAGPNTSRFIGKEGKKLQNDFRRVNNSLKNIRFVTYDELLSIFKNIFSKLSISK